MIENCNFCNEISISAIEKNDSFSNLTNFNSIFNENYEKQVNKTFSFYVKSNVKSDFSIKNHKTNQSKNVF